MPQDIIEIPAGVAFSEAETARIFGVSLRTLRRWNELRRGPVRAHIGRRPYYTRGALLRYIHYQDEGNQ